MDNNINNDLQLQEMRQQMTELKQQLDRQQIVNEQLLRQSMTSKMSWIKRYIWVEAAMIPVLLLILAPIHAMLGLSWWLYGFLAVMLVVDVAADFRINRIDRNQDEEAPRMGLCSGNGRRHHLDYMVPDRAQKLSGHAGQ